MSKAITEAIAGMKWEHSDRVSLVSKQSTQFSTGENQEEILERFRRYENKDQKAQRVRLTNTITPSVLAGLRRYFKKVSRIQGINILWPEATNEKANLVKNVADSYESKRSLLEYLNIELESLNVSDPNAYLLFDRYDIRDIEGNPLSTSLRVIVISSNDIVSVVKEKGTTVSVAWKESRFVIDSKGQKTEATDYYEVGPGYMWHFVENIGDVPEGYVVKKLINANKKTVEYLTQYFETGSKVLPVIAAGAYYDHTTKNQTFVTWFDSATGLLNDLIRDKSYLDVMKTLHAYPRRYEYTKPCSFEAIKEGKCERGQLTLTKETCPKCKGSGLDAHFTTEQEVTKLQMPKGTNADILALERLSFTETPNTSLLEFYRREVDKAVSEVQQSVVNSGIVARATGAATATEVNYEYEDIHDLLHPFVQKVAQAWELALEVYSNYLEIDNFKPLIRFPKNDYKMQTLSELEAAYKSATESGQGYDVLWIIKERIVEKLNEDDTQEVARIMNRFSWTPWVSKTEGEKAAIISVRHPQDFDRVLSENLDFIFDEIDDEFQMKFHLKPRAEQRKILESKVAQYSSKIKPLFTSQSADANIEF